MRRLIEDLGFTPGQARLVAVAWLITLIIVLSDIGTWPWE